MRYLSHNEINNALARGHFERSKQFHSLLARFFKSHETTADRRPRKHGPAMKSRIASV